MSESTLSIAFTDLRKRVAHFLGYNRDSTYWSAEETEIVDECIADGLSQFYFPPPVPGVELSHEWSFLKPIDTLVVWASIAVGTTTVTGVHNAGTTTVTATAASFHPSMIGKSLVITDIGTFTVTGYTSSTVIAVSGDATCAAKTFSMAADGTYRLPDDYGGQEGPWTFASGEGYVPIKKTSEQYIRDLYQNSSNMTGRPQYGAARPVDAGGVSAGQRWEALFWPIPDGEYSLSYRKVVLKNALTAGVPYPLGGAAHRNTVIESCLAIAESKMNDESGLHAARFAQALAASIAHDRRTGPVWLGYNGDGSSDGDANRLSRTSYVTVGDVYYEG